MNSSDNMDLDSMINDPFKFLNSDEENDTGSPNNPAGSEAGTAGKKTQAFVQSPVTQSPDKTTAINVDRINKNHPLELRMLGLEKNQFNWDKKVELLKEIVENQNERIELLEKELDILRNK